MALGSACSPCTPPSLSFIFPSSLNSHEKRTRRACNGRGGHCAPGLPTHALTSALDNPPEEKTCHFFLNGANNTAKFLCLFLKCLRTGFVNTSEENLFTVNKTHAFWKSAAGPCNLYDVMGGSQVHPYAWYLNACVTLGKVRTDRRAK